MVTLNVQVPSNMAWTPERAVAVGGAVALLGCFLPFATGGGESVNILTIANRVNSWVWLEPISAIALLWFGLTLSPQSPATGPATSLTLASAWGGVNLFFFVALSTAIGALGPFAAGGSVGIGLGFCTIGFLTATVASFLAVRDYMAPVDPER